jgi:hypothetical protein
MATMRDRTPADVRSDIEREREELVRAVAHLRSDLHRAANVKPLLRKAAIGAAAFTVAVLALKIVRRRFSR